MLSMRTVLALSLASFALAAPLAERQSGLGSELGAFCMAQYTPFAGLINGT